MTKKKGKRKDVSKSKQCRNDARHQRAMTDPRVQRLLSALRANWNDQIPQENGAPLKKLKDLGCPVRGIARELGKPASSIRRYIKHANSSESRSAWVAMMERTVAKEPEEETTMSAIEAARQAGALIPRKKGLGPVIEETHSEKDHVHSSTAPPAKKVTSPALTRAQELRAMNPDQSGKQIQAGSGEPRMSLVDAYKLSKGQSISDSVRRLEAIPDSIEPRPFQNARSMKRQGKPLPPEDTP